MSDGVAIGRLFLKQSIVKCLYEELSDSLGKPVTISSIW
jgi:hypothetical protein